MRSLLTHWLICAVMAFILPGKLSAQTANEPTVSDIKVLFSGLRNVSEAAVLSHVQIKEGDDYNQVLVDRSIRSLYDTRLFEFIEVKTDAPAPGSVEITFVVRSKYRVGSIGFSGNRKVKIKRLREEITSAENGVLDERQIKEDRDAIRDYYQKKGFSEARIDYNINRNTITGYGDVIFRIQEGDKLKIVDIDFVGNDSIPSNKLRKQIETRAKDWKSWLTGSGKFNEDDFSNDLQALLDFYKDRGFLDVDIPQTGVRLEYPTKNKIKITIPVDEGRQYQLGSIAIEGNTLYTYEKLAGNLSMKPGDVFSPSKLNDDESTLRNIYGRIGYLDTRVRTERLPNLETGAIDVKFTIREGDEVYVETVKVEGNTKTKSTVIIRELALAPGDVFDSIKMKSSEARLRNTRFFERVTLTDEPTNIPGRRNLKVDVQEGRTGNLTFGAGFSSLENAIVFVELTQGNFDLFNWRSFFQGDGQKFRLRLQLGSNSNEVVLTFEEPWLFERRLAFGFEVFRRESDYVSSVYDELRSGFEVYLRKRLVGLWEGRLSYRLENVDIRDVDDDAALEIQLEEGERTVSKVGFLLLRDTRDSLLFTSRGDRVSISTEFAGVGGDTDYLRLDVRGSKFIPTFEYGKQVVSILGRVGTLWDYSDSGTPFFDRFFLGGPNTLRGFDYREVGPKSIDLNREYDETELGIDVNNNGNTTDTNAKSTSTDPVGGNSYGFFSVEYSFQIAEPLRLAAFYDAGFVNINDWDFNPSGYNDNFGFGARILIMGAPLRLDFGFPLTTDDHNDDGTQFFFSFGTRF